jgi:formylglycine-generating enzyme required for sulfatase activity
MHGNVLEWCNDWYNEKYYEECEKQGIVENPLGAKSGDYKVLRGGSWSYNAQNCRSAFRNFDTPAFRYHIIGFRLVCSSVS